MSNLYEFLAAALTLHSISKINSFCDTIANGNFEDNNSLTLEKLFSQYQRVKDRLFIYQDNGKIRVSVKIIRLVFLLSQQVKRLRWNPWKPRE